MAVILSITGIVQADTLYNIATFNHAGPQPKVKYWYPGITTITSAPGITGTDDTGLFSLQTINVKADKSRRGPRFQNNNVGTDSPSGGMPGAITLSHGGYMQFGITGSNIDLTSLTFQAMMACWNNDGRGYDIDISINGDDYIDLDAAILTNHRKNGGMNLFTIDLTGFPRGISSVDFRLSSTGGAVEYIDIKINGTTTTIKKPVTLG